MYQKTLWYWVGQLLFHSIRSECRRAQINLTLPREKGNEKINSNLKLVKFEHRKRNKNYKGEKETKVWLKATLKRLREVNWQVSALLSLCNFKICINFWWNYNFNLLILIIIIFIYCVLNKLFVYVNVNIKVWTTIYWAPSNWSKFDTYI